jgi:hypothetical protein
MSVSTRRLGSAYKWTKDGWTRHSSTITTSTIQKCYEQTNFDGPETVSDIGLITRAYNQIQVGSIGLEFDQLPGPVKQLLYSPDVWHISPGGKLFRVIDEIEQVKEFGEWGSDHDDVEDNDSEEEIVSATRLFLEQSGLADAESLCSETADALCTVVSGSMYFNPASEEEDRESIIPPPATETQPFPSLPKEIELQVENITKEFKEHQTLIKQNPEGRKPEEVSEILEALAHAYERRIDELIRPILTLSLSSPYCGRGYRSPQRKYSFIPIQQPSRVVNAAEERDKFFYKLFGKASSCRSREDLFGPITRDTRKTLPSSGGPVPNPNYMKTERTGGFYGEIRGMHASDKALAMEWSMHPTYVNKAGETIESAFTIQRKKFITEWREQQRGDEESLRIALWAWFDRTAGEKPAEYDKNNKLTKKRKVFKDSIWKQKRTEALVDLFLTKPQWDAIYSILGLIKQRISINPSKDFTNEREKVLTKLRKIFLSIENLSDLNAYMAWAQKRYWHHDLKPKRNRKLSNGEIEPVMIGPRRKTYKFTPSMIDRISVIDEINWKTSCTRKRKHLQNRFMLGRYLAKQIASIEETQLPETSVVCHDPKCDCMALGSPMKATFPNNQTASFINCSGCNQPVWLIKPEEKYPCEENILRDIRCAQCNEKHKQETTQERKQRCKQCRLG